MPDRQTRDTPGPEPLTLRLLRETFDKRGLPRRCPRRQCRRSRYCSGPALRPNDPLNADERLPPCALRAKPEARRQFQALAADLLPPLDDSTAPGTWPEDREAANHLRQALAIVARIHTRPGPHPASERAALAAWHASDPAPEVTALCDRLWRQPEPEKRPAANPPAAVRPVAQDASCQAAQGPHA
ncbi:hypothetical protein H6M51_10860 [Rhizobium sp. AQ_MP]|uniref:hypothetical protein n=1 Tax=Rhizobium sp. AQ_MP TaxID=2761536 RepID=UPI0016398073|nr:hypothetical protein [Rhizobium sp. AQ_MP]MBC2773367.1 hypothetical protein [Rhizobium sp. AQ_MP]